MNHDEYAPRLDALGCLTGHHNARILDGIWSCRDCPWTRPKHPPLYPDHVVLWDHESTGDHTP